MKKVLIINGSPRKEGNTSIALKEVASQLEKNGIETEILWIGTQPVRGCIACGQCKLKGNNQCIFNDDICNTVTAKMAQMDGIILGSPVYWGQPAAQLMALQQRMLYSACGNFEGKPAAVVTVCRRGGATAAFQTLQMPFQMVNMPIVTSQYWNIVYGCTPGESAQDGEGLQTMRTLANNMAKMLHCMESGTNNPLPKEDRIATNFIR